MSSLPLSTCIAVSIERTGAMSDASQQLIAALARLSDEYHVLVEDVESTGQVLEVREKIRPACRLSLLWHRRVW